MNRPLAEFPVLIAQSGPLNGQRWGIENDIHIGRDTDCDIVIPDRQVSRFHAKVSTSPDGIVLEDLGSKNGTFCNGEQIDGPVFLKDGDIVQISLIQFFYFLSSDATLPLDQQIPVIDFAKKTHGDAISLDAKSRRVWVGENEMIPPLSVPQFRLLQILYEQEGKVVSRYDLVTAIWGNDRALGVSEQALDALIRRLRERLAILSPDSEFLVTVRGHGIRLENH
jgi:DNA-binding winged helix-turn-helix (wHTH) protein